MTLAYVVGARPNFVKTAPVIGALRRRLPEERHVVIHTGQHYDRAMSELFIEQLGVGEPDVLLGVGSGSHAVQTARIMERLEPVLERERPDLLFVPGDVNSTLAATLVAAKLDIPIAHIESGLRSFDRTMPEEINRIVADEFSDYLFVHSDEGLENLRAEGIAEARVHFVGNTMIDSLVAMEQTFRTLGAAGAFGVQPGEYLLVTLHRPSLVDGPLLAQVIEELAAVASGLPVVFPVHPRTRKMLDGLPQPSGLLLTEPLGYLEFLSLEADAAAVLTDSGGVQEETTFLGVRCFTLRANTERPVTVRLGTNTLLGLEPERIREIPGLLAAEPMRAAVKPPLWDGQASERIADVVERSRERASTVHSELAR
jgi:UDP-N-acetylglucosamine 2-epimerase (non-hydrolysing)